MGLPVTVYRWDDAGAPQLVYNNASSMIDVLKAVLVNGYGTKPSLGWSLVFDDSAKAKAVFRNSMIDGGTGSFLRMMSTSGSTIGVQWQYDTAIDMTNIDTMFKKGISQQFRVESSGLNWYIVGTSRGFYLHIMNGSVTTCQNSYFGAYEPMMFFGDIKSYYANDTSAFIAAFSSKTADSTGVAYVDSLSRLGANNTIAKVYDTDGFDHSQLYYSSGSIITSNGTGFDGTFESYGVDIQLDAVQLRSSTSATIPNDRNGLSSSVSQLTPYIRGELPGLLWCNVPAYSNNTWPFIKDMDGIQYLLVRSYHKLQLWIRLGDWYD